FKFKLEPFLHLIKYLTNRKQSVLKSATALILGRSEEIPSGFPRYGSGLHTSSTALRDCPRTWVSRKRETCVKPRAVMGNGRTTPTDRQTPDQLTQEKSKKAHRTGK